MHIYTPVKYNSLCVCLKIYNIVFGSRWCEGGLRIHRTPQNPVSPNCFYYFIFGFFFLVVTPPFDRLIGYYYILSLLWNTQQHIAKEFFLCLSFIACAAHSPWRELSGARVWVCVCVLLFWFQGNNSNFTKHSVAAEGSRVCVRAHFWIIHFFFLQFFILFFILFVYKFFFSFLRDKK